MLSRLEDKRSTSMLYGFFCEVRATYVPASRAAKANSSRGHVETIKTNRQRRACSTHLYKGPKSFEEKPDSWQDTRMQRQRFF